MLEPWSVSFTSADGDLAMLKRADTLDPDAIRFEGDPPVELRITHISGVSFVMRSRSSDDMPLVEIVVNAEMQLPLGLLVEDANSANEWRRRALEAERQLEEMK